MPSEQEIKDGRYSRIEDVPTKLLARNFVGSLIMAKGNLNMYGDLTEMLIRQLRGEPDPVVSPQADREKEQT